MTVDSVLVERFFRRAMVARIATLSASGRPSITPLYFVAVEGHLWLGTASWTLAARSAQADPRVVVLLQLEREPDDQRVLRVTGRAVVNTDPALQKRYTWLVARKYSLSPGGLWNHLVHWRQFRLMDRYHQQSAAKGPACIIDISPQRVELM